MTLDLRLAAPLALVGLLAPAPARAEINYGESLDWMTVDSDVVARGTVVSAGTEVIVGDLIAMRGAIGLTEVTATPAGCLPVDLKPGEPVVVFLRADGAGWVPRCATERAQQWVLSLDDPERAYTIEGRALQSGAEVLAHIGMASARPLSHAVKPAATPDERFHLHQGPLRVDAGGDAARDLYAGSAVWLGIPPYEDLRAAILERSRSQDPYERQEAAFQLANYPGADVEKRLRELLADDYVSEHVSDGKVVDHSWPVREAARTALTAHGNVP